MKKILLVAVVIAMVTGCSSREEPILTGTSQGYNGEIKVQVTMLGEDISRVEVVSHSETDGIGTKAVEEMPSKIVTANSTNVEAVATATVTSEAIKKAVDNALASR